MWSVIGDLMYEEENLLETIRYCRAHNRFLRDIDLNEIESKFWPEIRFTGGEIVAENLVKAGGHIEPVYNAWFVIDPTPDGLKVPLEEGQEQMPHMINSFVRLGRRPAISIA